MTKNHKLFDLQNYEHSYLFDNCEYPWEVLSKLKFFFEKQTLGVINGDVSPQAFLLNEDQIYVGEGTIIEPGVCIKGPCYIGKNCKIKHAAYIRDGVIIGSGSVIGHATEIKNSVLLNNVKAGHFNYIGDSVVGNAVNLGAGMKCANLRLDSKPISVIFDGEKINTGLRKLGAIIGDGAKLGCNSVTSPGMIIKRGGIVLPCTDNRNTMPSQKQTQMD